MKKILLLGATGSIGLQTIDIIEQHPDQLMLVGVCAGNQKEVLENIVQKHPSIEVIGLARQDVTQIHDKPVFTGPNCMEACIEHCEYDILVNAVVGFRGLLPTLLSIQKGKDVALANKESLVAGGPLVKEALKCSPAKLYPIDSEHSAIFQCLQGNQEKNVARLIITASGGSFRDRKREELKDVSVKETLSHPNWSMGQRITVDSATMINKGFEVIEAHYLFDLPYSKIDTVLHPQSIVHSMVEYNDHAIMAQLGSADMRLPIQYALLYPDRPFFHENKPLDMTKTLSLDFKEMDFERYPLLALAYKVGQRGGNLGAILNAADEQAVELFLKEEISFLQIEEAIEQTIEQAKFIENPNFEQLLESDAWARTFIKEFALQH